MATYFIDSNIFFYAKIMDRDYGEACAKVIDKVAKGKLKAITSGLILTELANALRKYGLNREVRDVVDAIFSLRLEVYDIDALDVRVAMEIFDELRISPYDCVHLAIMKKAGTPNIISADREFDKATWIKRLDPMSLEAGD